MMRTTVNLDDGLLANVQGLTGTTGRKALIDEGLRALIQRESARARYQGMAVGLIRYSDSPSPNAPPSLPPQQ